MIKRKQRFSLRKNKIGAMSVLLGISFVGAVASGSDVKANEISEEKAPKLIEKEVVGKTTKQDVEKAQAKVDASKEAESLKNKAIENKKTEITNNDNEISKIKADIERDKDATDENINKAEKKVESATEELKNKNSELVKTKAEKEERESDLVLVKKDVADKTKDLETKQAKAKEIKDEIDSTENVTKKLETEKAKNEELKAKTTELDNAKKDELAKKAELDNLLMPYGRNVKYKIALDQRFVDKFKEYMDYTLNWEEKGITMKDMFAKRRELRDQLKAIEKEIKHEFLYNRYNHEDDYEIDLRNMSEEERLKMSEYGVYLLNQIRNQFGLEPLKVNKNSMQLAKEITETVMRDNHYDLYGGHYIKGISEVAAKHGLLRGANCYENLFNVVSKTFSDHKMSRNALYEHVYNSVMLFFYEGIINGVVIGNYGHAESLYKAKTPMGLAVAHFENVDDVYNINRLPKEFIEKNKQYIEFDEFGNMLGFKSMPLDVYDELSNIPKRGIIKISYVKVEEDAAIPGSVDAEGMPTYDDPSEEAIERAKQNFIAKYSNESKDTVELPAVPDLEGFKKAYEAAVKVRESKEQPVVDAKANVNSATKALDKLNATEKQTVKATAKVQEVDAKINNLTTKADEQQKVIDQLELDNVKYIEKMTKLAADLDATQKDVNESAKLLEQAKTLQKDIENEIVKVDNLIADLTVKVEAATKELDDAKANVRQLRIAKFQLEQNKEKLAKEVAVKSELEKELSILNSELVAIQNQLTQDTKELEKVQRQYNLDNFTWAVLADNNTNEPVEFDLDKYLKDEEEKKKQSERKAEESGDKTPGEKAPGSRNNKSELQRPSVNSNGLNTLPNTGESQTGAATVAGLVALAVATRLRQRKEK